MADTLTLTVEAAENEKSTSEFRRIMGRLRRQPVTIAAGGFIVGLILVAVFAPLLAPHDPTQTNFDNVLQPPSAEFPLGTDNLGYDQLSRLIFGTQIVLTVAAGSVLIAMLIGVPIGLLLGYKGGWWDRLGTRFVDVADALPGLMVGIVTIAILGRNMFVLMFAIGLIFSMNFARITRAVTLAERTKLYVDAAVVTGLRSTAIVFRQVLPNLIGPLIIQAAVFLGSSIMIESALSFLGLGLDTEVPTWGSMLTIAVENQSRAGYLVWAPGFAIIFTVLAFNLLGDGLNDALTGGTRRRPRRRRPDPVDPEPRGAAASATAAGALAYGSSTSIAASSAIPAQREEAVTRELPVMDTEVEVSSRDTDILLEVQGLGVELRRPEGDIVPLVDDVWFSIKRGEVVGLVGESGSGKSMLAKAILGLLPPATRLANGSIVLDGDELAFRSERSLRSVRGTGVGVVFQDPLSAFSPVHTVGQQLLEPLRLHKGMNRQQARARAAELLARVGVDEPEKRLDEYPHQFSGGMAQRAAIAMALASEPKLLIADEATSALDVTTQSQVLDLLLDLRDEFGMAILLITHDLGVVAESCDRAAVMYAGQIVEVAEVAALFDAPRHPYTAALLAANPSSEAQVDRLPTIPGRVPLAGMWPAGCHFASRCRFARDECVRRPVPINDGVRCVRAAELELEVLR